jgi:hypothetical protein
VCAIIDVDSCSKSGVLGRRLARSIRAFALFATGLAGTFAPQASAQIHASVAPANLNHLVENAQTIVRGYVLSVSVEPHPEFANLQTVAVTFAVSEVLKGQSDATLRFRQLNIDARDVPGPGYHKAEELLLFLNPVSPYGLTSPVGLEQGRFRILRDKKGNKLAVNGYNNIGLFSDVANKSRAAGVVFSARAQAMLAASSGTVSVDSFEDAVRSLVGGHR